MPIIESFKKELAETMKARGVRFRVAYGILMAQLSDVPEIQDEIDCYFSRRCGGM